jgi:cardiolipin synthase
MEAFPTVLAVAVTLLELLGILAAVHAVMNARTSQGATAWAIALVMLPLVSLVPYAIFGRNKFQGYVNRRSRQDAHIHHLSDLFQAAAQARDMIRPPRTEAQRALTGLARMPILKFNRSALLINGAPTFARMFADLAAARHYILLEFYEVKDDGLGRRLKDCLMQKAAEGVRIHFLYDEIGSYQLPGAFLREMQHVGIEVSAFHSTKGKTNHLQINFRNHRKIVVVDGATAYVGGHNVGDEYASRHPQLGPWRDTHVRLQGPIVQAIQFCFAEDWYWATSRIPDLVWEPTPAPGGAEDALAIASGPADALETCGLMFTQAIHMARERIWIASPYFVPDIQILGALKLAALRGVDVRLLIPAKPDHRTVHLASFAYYPLILPVGIKLYRYTGGFLHQKVFLVDRQLAAVGTANLDNRSFRLNFELTLLNFEAGFVDAVAAMLVEDFAHSRPESLAAYTKRPFLFRLAVQSARLLAPIL